jgi:hypothetical protein
MWCNIDVAGPGMIKYVSLVNTDHNTGELDETIIAVGDTYTFVLINDKEIL